MSSSMALAASLTLPSVHGKPTTTISRNDKDRFDPWIEVIPEALVSNAKTLSVLAGNTPVLAVIKNNGYGLGDVTVAKVLDGVPEVIGFAAVKTEACVSVREAGIKKPILHMGMASEQDCEDLISKQIQLSVYEPATQPIIEAIANRRNLQVKAHLYVDTGMSRMGIPYHKAIPLVESIDNSNKIEVVGSFMGFTEEPDFDREQLRRFRILADEASSRGVDMGTLHAASSNAIFHFPESSLDMVRPGIGLYGAYPTYPDQEREIAELKVAYRLRARVVRVEQLREGDSVSYGRKYVAEKPTWVATLPVGHADGYLREAVGGLEILVNDRLYPVIGAVSASHTIIEIGDERTVKVGDVATLVGPDHPEIHPSTISTRTGVSVYDVLMHMSSRLPKYVVSS